MTDEPAQTLDWIAHHARAVEAAGELASTDWARALGRAADGLPRPWIVALNAEIATQTRYDLEILPAAETVANWRSSLPALDAPAAADDVRRAVRATLSAFPNMTAHAPEHYFETLIFEITRTAAPIQLVSHACAQVIRESVALPSAAEMLLRIGEGPKAGDGVLQEPPAWLSYVHGV